SSRQIISMYFTCPSIDWSNGGVGHRHPPDDFRSASTALDEVYRGGPGAAPSGARAPRLRRFLAAVLPDELAAPCVERAKHAAIALEREIGEVQPGDVSGLQRPAASDDSAPGELDGPQLSGDPVLPELALRPCHGETSSIRRSALAGVPVRPRGG